MKIVSVKISNLMSFQYIPNLENAASIMFETKKELTPLSILIGPNGSGKTNFFQIISDCIQKGLMTRYSLNKELLERKRQGKIDPIVDFRNTITHNDGNQNVNLSRNEHSPEVDSEILLTICLTESDFQNIDFIIKNKDKLKSYLSEFTQHGNFFDNIEFPEPFPQISTLEIAFKIGGSMVRFTDIQIRKPNQPEVKFLRDYLHCFHLFQHVITVHNKLCIEGEEWAPLKDVVAILNGYRDLPGINTGYAIDISPAGRQTDTGENLKSSDFIRNPNTSAIFPYVSHRLFDLFHKYKDIGGNDFASQKLKSESFLKDINVYLEKTLSISVDFHYVDNHHCELLFRKNKNLLNLNQLSLGERSIVLLIFTTVGCDLRGGLFLVDEPELHLHPQIQSKVLQMLETVGAEYDLQIILATHSAGFITESTIEKVYRFISKQPSGSSNIIRPDFTGDEKLLMKALELTNSTKIFFANKVILVEGETDEYALRFLINDLNGGRQDIEVLNIQGKGNRFEWETFLRKLQLDVFFIGDFDNVVDQSILNQKEIGDIWKKICAEKIKTLESKHSYDRQRLCAILDGAAESPSTEVLGELKTLIEHLKLRHVSYKAVADLLRDTIPTRWADIKKAIEQERKKGTFILTQGEIEDYLGCDKGLPHVRKFCNYSYTNWKKSPDFVAQRDELFEILNSVMLPNS
jgi:putative ATP-dependent endonuclease of OLD family